MNKKVIKIIKIAKIIVKCVIKLNKQKVTTVVAVMFVF